MKNIKVELLEYTSSEPLINAVSKPYRHKNPSIELAEKIANVNKHDSILEHVYFNFDLRGISRACLQQLVRHRLASYTVESTRYVMKEFKDLINKQPFEILDRDILKFFVDYENKYHFLFIINYLQNLKNVVDLPNDLFKQYLIESFRTQVAFSINLRSLRNFIDLRTDEHAHIEIKYVANIIKDLVKQTEYKNFI